MDTANRLSIENGYVTGREIGGGGWGDGMEMGGTEMKMGRRSR